MVSHTVGSKCDIADNSRERRDGSIKIFAMREIYSHLRAIARFFGEDGFPTPIGQLLDRGWKVENDLECSIVGCLYSSPTKSTSFMSPVTSKLRVAKRKRFDETPIM